MTTATQCPRRSARKASCPATDLQSIPGIGPSLAKDLLDLGIQQPSDLKGRNPLLLYHQLCQLRRHPIDRCVLYTFRCAVYFASQSRHNPKLLKWWHWKDREYNE